MARTILLLCYLFSACLLASPRDDVSSTLNSLHKSASAAEYDRYFSLYAKNAVFIGTDASEVWPIEEFKAYAKPYFDKGQGWTYHPRNRHIYFAQKGNVAWFDELLDSESYGVTRGTGVLEKIEGKWKVTQYHLTIPLPNELAKDVTRQIQAFKEKAN